MKRLGVQVPCRPRRSGAIGWAFFVSGETRSASTTLRLFASLASYGWQARKEKRLWQMETTAISSETTRSFAFAKGFGPIKWRNDRAHAYKSESWQALQRRTRLRRNSAPRLARGHEQGRMAQDTPSRCAGLRVASSTLSN